MNRLSLYSLAKSAGALGTNLAPYFVMDMRQAPETVGDAIDSGLVFLADGRFSLPFASMWLQTSTQESSALYVTTARGRLEIYWCDVEGQCVVVAGHVTVLRQPTELKIDAGLYFWCHGMQLKNPSTDDVLSEKLLDDVNQIIALCFLINHPQNVVVQSFPSVKRNDTNWVKSRSHWHIVPRSYGRTLRANPSAPFEEIRSLAAHYRRAHFRTYRAECYGKMRGRRGWVRSCWVGPREWEGSDGKIYRVVDPTPSPVGVGSEGAMAISDREIKYIIDAKVAASEMFVRINREVATEAGEN